MLMGRGGDEALINSGCEGGRGILEERDHTEGKDETEEVKVGIALSRMQGDQGIVCQSFL